MGWINKPITWGAYVLLCVISLVVSLAGAIGMLFSYRLITWSDVKDYVKENFHRKKEPTKYDGDYEF